MKLTFVGSFLVNEFFESGYVTGEIFFTCLSLLVAWFISVCNKHLFTVLEIEESNILTLSPTTALENVQLTQFVLHLAALTPYLSDQFH